MEARTLNEIARAMQDADGVHECGRENTHTQGWYRNLATAALAVVQPELDRLRAENADLAHREKVRSEAINKCLTDANDRADYAHARADFCARLYDQREEYLAGLDATNAELRAENEALRRERVTVLEKALGEIESQALAAPLARDNFELIDMLQSVYGISSRARAALSAPARDEEGR